MRCAILALSDFLATIHRIAMETLSGIVHGNTIELSDIPKVADGAHVLVMIQPATNSPEARPKLPGPPPEWEPGKTVAGCLAAVWTDEDDRILAEIERERQSATFRKTGE
jgi:hypothetical protein